MRSDQSRYVKVPQRLVEVTLGVPGLGMVKEIYDMNEPNDCLAWDKNVEIGSAVLSIRVIYEDTSGRYDISIY